ncbi:hypothetical protein SH528x_001946 [Novipirellula sp. SH528]|uniref:hypothetical protein n=1 Tax=Novipirellula sp. SH528 TaxID=3454466 RepID=UPI003FA00E9F
MHTSLFRLPSRIWIAALAVVVAAGCEPSTRPNPLPSDRESSTAKPQAIVKPSSKADVEIPLADLIGKWTGKSYQGERGNFATSPPLALDKDGQLSRFSKRKSVAEVDLILEIEEKYLAMKGIEICHLTLSYKSADSERSTERESYRIIPEDTGQITLRRGAGVGEFQLKLEDDSTLSIEGTHPTINSGSRFPIKATLKCASDNAELPKASSDDPMILEPASEQSRK